MCFSGQEFASRNGSFSGPIWIHRSSLLLTLCFAFGLQVCDTNVLFKWRNCFSLNRLKKSSAPTMTLSVFTVFYENNFFNNNNYNSSGVSNCNNNEWKYKYHNTSFFKKKNLFPPDNVPQSLPALLQLPAVGNSYHFSTSVPSCCSHSRDFYRVNNIFWLSV